MTNAIKEQESYKTNTKNDARRKQMAIIQDFLNGYQIIHSMARWKTKDSQLSQEEWEKMYVSYNYMKKIINELKTLAPYIDTFTTEDEDIVKFMKKTLEKDYLNWTQLEYEVYETLETKGDFYMTFFSDEDSKLDGISIPKILLSANMDDVLVNPITKKVEAYIYKERVWEESLNESLGTLEDVNMRDVVWIFQKGKVRINDPIKYSNPKCSDCGMEYDSPISACSCGSTDFEIGYRIYYDKPEYQDIIRVVHVPSYKKQSDKFSEIPASQYIDPCLLADKLDMERDIIISHLAFPIPIIIEGYIDGDNSCLIAGGGIVIKANDGLLDLGKFPEVKIMEINNELKSLVDAKDDCITDLYKKACLMREGLEEKMAGSDSSRNSSQLRLGIEMKNKKYFTNIAEAFNLYFKVNLYENGLITQEDFESNSKYTFKLPDVFINNSMFEELLLTQQKRAMGKSTLSSEMREEGHSDKEIEERKEEVVEELYGKNNDMSYNSKEVTDIVSNSENTNDIAVKGMDNNFK